MFTSIGANVPVITEMSQYPLVIEANRCMYYRAKLYGLLQRVRLHFLSLHLQNSTDCINENIKIYDGADTRAPLMKTLCGSTVPGDVRSTANTVFVHLYSCGGTSTYSGFKIFYSDLVVPGGMLLRTLSVESAAYW